MNEATKLNLNTLLITAVGFVPPMILLNSAKDQTRFEWMVFWGLVGSAAVIGFALGFSAQQGVAVRWLVTGCAPLLAALVIISLVFIFLIVGQESMDNALRGLVMCSIGIFVCSAPAIGFARMGHLCRHRKP